MHGVRPFDEIVLINVRPAGCTTNTEQLADKIVAERYAPSSETGSYQWGDASWQEVAAENDPAVATVFYTHGNDIPLVDARRRGLDVYRKLIRYDKESRPIRFVIWAWPSSPVKGKLRNYRIKAARTRPVAFQLAWFVQQLPPDMPLGFFGYSYGARIENGAAHLLAGGSLGGLRLDTPPAFDRPTEHVYIAPAFEADWLSPRGAHSRAMRRIDHLLTTSNRLDPAMRFYPLLSKTITERALGFRGPTDLTRGYASRVQVAPATESVGRSHDLYDYMQTPCLMAKAWRRLTFEGETPAIADEAAPLAAASLAVSSKTAPTPAAD